MSPIGSLRTRQRRHSIQKTMKDNKVYLTMHATKDALKSAPSFKYDSTKTTWVPDTASTLRLLYFYSVATVDDLDQWPLRNVLVEILRDALKHARIVQRHRSVHLAEHAPAPEPRQSLVGVHQR